MSKYGALPRSRCGNLGLLCVVPADSRANLAFTKHLSNGWDALYYHYSAVDL